MRTGMHIGKTVRALALAGFTVAGTVLAGCSGGTQRIDSQVPVGASRNVTGVWRIAALTGAGKRLTCQDPSSILGSPITELTDRNVVVAACGARDTYTFGAMDVAGRGRYRIDALGNSEEGTFQVKDNTLTLVRDTANGAGLPTPLQKLIFRIDTDGANLVFTPVAQPAAYRKIVASDPAFNDDGSLNSANLTPVLNSDNTVNIIVLPDTDTVPVVQPDLTISTVNPLSARDASDTPGFVRRYQVSYTVQKL